MYPLFAEGSVTAFRNTLISDTFRPLHLRYLQYNSLNHSFQLFLDKGDSKNPRTQELENTCKELLKYFFIGISLPNDSFWVNLRPDAEDNIIDDYLARTDIGKIMLESDLQLKEDTALATSPETPEGRKYWDKLYKKAGELFGSENITIPTLTRPWIVPDEIIIRETVGVESESRDGLNRPYEHQPPSAYIYKATLKVMLEQDYLKDSSGGLNVRCNFDDSRSKTLNEYSSQLIRELIIPKLTKEINTSKRYAPLRQVYYSLILAQWFKARNKQVSGRVGLNLPYLQLIDSRNLANLTSKTPWSKTAYFNEYQKSFKEGEYSIQQPIYTPYGQSIRSYFSGGIIATSTDLDLALRSPTAKVGNVMVASAVNDFNANSSPFLAEMRIQANNPGKIIFRGEGDSSAVTPAVARLAEDTHNFVAHNTYTAELRAKNRELREGRGIIGGWAEGQTASSAVEQKGYTRREAIKVGLAAAASLAAFGLGSLKESPSKRAPRFPFAPELQEEWNKLPESDGDYEVKQLVLRAFFGETEAVDSLRHYVDFVKMVQLRSEHLYDEEHISGPELEQRLKQASFDGNPFMLYLFYLSPANFSELSEMILAKLKSKADEKKLGLNTYLEMADRHKIFYRDFILQAANFSQLRGLILNAEPLEGIMDLLFKELLQDQIVSYSLRLALFVEGVLNDKNFKYQKEFQGYLEKLYDAVPAGLNKHLIAALLMVYQDKFTYLRRDDINRIGRGWGIETKDTPIDYPSLFNKNSGVLTAHIVFADEDAVEGHYESTESFFLKGGYKRVTSVSGNNRITLENKQGNVRLVLIKADKDGYDINRYFNEAGVFILRAHQGHEYRGFKTQTPPLWSKGKLFLVSTCRSATKEPDFALSYPQAEIISVRAAAYGSDTNSLVHYLFEALAQKEVFPTFETIRAFLENEPDLKEKKILDNYVLPGDPAARVAKIIREGAIKEGPGLASSAVSSVVEEQGRKQGGFSSSSLSSLDRSGRILVSSESSGFASSAVTGIVYEGLCLTPDSLIHLADGTTNGSTPSFDKLRTSQFDKLTALSGVEGLTIGAEHFDSAQCKLRRSAKPLIELKEGDMVLSLNEAAGRLEPHKVVALLDMGVKPVYRIRTKLGKELKTTLNHPYLTKDGWKKLREIKVGEEIVVLNEDYLEKTKEYGFNLSYRGRGQLSQLLTDEEFIHSDNLTYFNQRWFRKASGPELFAGKEVFIGVDFFGNFGGNGYSNNIGMGRVKFSRGNNYCWSLFESTKVSERKRNKNDLSLTKGCHRYYPRDYSRTQRTSLLFLEEGYHPAVTLAAGVGPEGVFAVGVSLIERFLSLPFLKYPHSFSSPDKKYTIPSLLSQDDLRLTYEPVISIDYLGNLPVYDIEVEGTHNFVAQGIVAHNTAIPEKPVTSPSTTLGTGTERSRSASNQKPEEESQTASSTAEKAENGLDPFSAESSGSSPVGKEAVVSPAVKNKFERISEQEMEIFVEGRLKKNYMWQSGTSIGYRFTDSRGIKNEIAIIWDITSSLCSIMDSEVRKVIFREPEMFEKLSDILMDGYLDAIRVYPWKNFQPGDFRITAGSNFNSAGPVTCNVGDKEIKALLEDIRSGDANRLQVRRAHIRASFVHELVHYERDEIVGFGGSSEIVSQIAQFIAEPGNNEIFNKIVEKSLDDLAQDKIDELKNMSHYDKDLYIGLVILLYKLRDKVAAIPEASELDNTEYKIPSLKKLKNIFSSLDVQEFYALRKNVLEEIIYLNNTQLRILFFEAVQALNIRQEVKEILSASSAVEDEGIKDPDGFCLTPDSLIHLADGTTRPLIELKPFSHFGGVKGDMVLSLNEAAGRLEPHRVNALLDMGVKPVSRIRTKLGKELKTTLNHPYLTKDGWRKLKDIKTGDEIACLAGRQAVGPDLFRPDSNAPIFYNKELSIKMGFIKSLKKIIGIFNDFIFGHIFNIDNHDTARARDRKAQDIAKVFIEGQENAVVFNRKVKNSAIRGPSGNNLSGPDNLQFTVFQRFDNVAINALVSNNLHKRALGLRDYLGGMFHKLRGIFNSGNDILFGNAGILLRNFFYSIASANEIENIAYRNPCSLNAGLAKSDIRSNYNFFLHNFYTSIKKIITSSNVRQDTIFLRLAAENNSITVNSGLLWDKIVSIEPLGPMQVYDIEVEGTHNFVAQGIVAHNTYQNAGDREQGIEKEPTASSAISDKGGIDGSASSPSIHQETKAQGGIDFRALPIVTRAMSNLSLNVPRIPLSSIEGINLDQELREIQRLVEAGITPSAERIREYVQASCLKGNSDMRKVVSCIADILRLEEGRCYLTDATLKDILVVLESGRPVQELKAVFTGVDS